MKTYFYCSYNQSPTGYQEIALDLETGVQTRDGGPEVIKTLFTHGGAKSALGFDGSAYYLVLKGMRVTKSEVPADTAGRDWYMNCALTASAEELPQLCAAAYYGYTAYSLFAARLAACLTPESEAVSYAVDVPGWRRVLEEASGRYQAFLESGAVDFSDAPGALTLQQMKPAIKVLHAQKMTSLYEFALLEGNPDYFFSSIDCTDRSRLRHYVSLNAEESSADGRETDESPIPGILLGGAAVLAGVYAGCQIGKCIVKAVRKKQERRMGDGPSRHGRKRRGIEC